MNVNSKNSEKSETTKVFETRKLDESDIARVELSQRLEDLGSTLAESVKTTAHVIVSDTLTLAESQLRSTLSHVNPRSFVRRKPLLTLAGAFAVGMFVTTRRRRPSPTAASTLLPALALLGIDLLRAYGLLMIQRASEPNFELMPADQK